VKTQPRSKYFAEIHMTKPWEMKLFKKLRLGSVVPAGQRPSRGVLNRLKALNSGRTCTNRGEINTDKGMVNWMEAVTDEEYRETNK
jgi:hypothetical protein